MKILTLIIIFFINLYAINFEILKKYKENGINNLKKFLDKSLGNKQFWFEYLSNYDLRYGYYENKDFLIICYKDKKLLRVYKKQNQQFENIFNTTVIIGKNNGDKAKEGDLKTPIGVYQLTKKLTRLDSFYGPFAIETNYPNEFDKLLDKTGHGIWIHGTPINNSKREPWTKGCIAMDNNQLCILDKKIQITKSSFIITDQNIKTNIDEIATILSNLYTWKYAWEYNDLEKYLSFYDKNFKKLNGMALQQFIKYKTRVFAKKEHKQIIFKHINIIPYPNIKHKKIFKIEFFEDYKSDTFRFKGDKILYIELNNNTISILSEG